MMGKQQVSYKVEDKVMTITIDNPETKNGLDWEGIEQFAACYQALNASDEIVCAVIRGNRQYFWTGGRVNPNAEGEQEKYANAIEKLNAAQEANEKPIIAAIEGDCMKAGMGLAASADFAIAREGVKFSYPEVRMGGVPMMVLVDTIGKMPLKKELEAYLSSWEYTAEEMLGYGFLNCVVPQEEFEATVEKYVRIFTETPEVIVRLTMKAYKGMCALPDRQSRNAFGMKMLREEVLPAMTTIKQHYNV